MKTNISRCRKKIQVARIILALSKKALDVLGRASVYIGGVPECKIEENDFTRRASDISEGISMQVFRGFNFDSIPPENKGFLKLFALLEIAVNVAIELVASLEKEQPKNPQTQ